MSDWIAQHFLHPSYVLPWGVAILSLPVIIHLINRLRFRRVRFAAMEFLLKSERRNRRRLLIEQLLLLFLRIALVAGLLILVSRLVLDPSALWAFRGAKSHHVVLLDDSGSMRDRWGETSSFREGMSIVRRLVAEGARRPGTQQLTLLLLSQPERPLFDERDVNNALVVELENAFEHLQCRHQALDLVTGVEAAARLLQREKTGARHLHVVSDFRAFDWRERPALRGAFADVAKTGASIDLARTVAERHENLAITDLHSDARTAAAGVPVRLKATVRNYGTKVAEHIRLAVEGDGVLLPLTVEIDRLDPGTERQRDIDVTFKAPGKHLVEVRLPEDALSADNHRFAALDISIANPVLIIDGSPEGDDGQYIYDALAADTTVTGFSARIENPDFLRRESLDPFRCIYLLNIHDLPADSVEILADYVRRGGGVAWFVGDVVNTSFYNTALYEKASGLFPVRLAAGPKQMVRADESSKTPDLAFANHPVFRVFEGQNNPFTETVKINSWIPVADDWVRDDNKRKDQTSTIAHIGPGKEPFAFERRYGKGRVLAFLTTAGPKWNNWGRNPSVVIFNLELAKYMSREDQTLQPRIVGEPIEIAFNPAEYMETVEVTAPASAGQSVTRLKAVRPSAGEHPSSAPSQPAIDHSQPVATKADKGTPAAGHAASPSSPPPTGGHPRAEPVTVAARYADTDRPGLYMVRLFKDQASAPQERWIAYNVPAEESDLTIATTTEILARLTNDVHVQIHEPGAFHWIEGHSAGQEARTLLLMMLAVGLVAEQLFAYRLSYHPAAAKGVA